ncbi:Rieske 2Fe-2S domain-containing protein [Altererythrobacter salegens]|uniref:Rieske 2Fe-2S domain-containing protein n=1 Tax=Croceibacterium salegens TaxID=1737568 RepID=A0A6I4SXM9_9SPHN|nr:aromatic ring-hydroxylating dioxygenase subunit alpha [Croceibacterium salegens]MXO60099.1 Rieske 2Fe-2S domain-containing protein [Croceibacterium salegens]
MFTDFANVWTIVGAADDLKAGKMLPLTVAGERVVLFRNPDGTPAALLDRCPHRGVQLSLGKLCNGMVECPFHGWRFDGSGANRGVPWNPDAKTEVLGATALPVREVVGLLWLFTGHEADGEPQPSPTLTAAGTRTILQSERWQTHWTRVMENMLDMPHLPFVHGGSIGRALRDKTGERMDVQWTPTETGALVENVSPDRTGKTGSLEYRYPNAMELNVSSSDKVFRFISVGVPETATTTRIIFITVRSFNRSRLFDPLFRWGNRRIAREDQAILESSDPFEIPPPGQEKSVRTDAPTLAFRKIWFERLKGSAA